MRAISLALACSCAIACGSEPDAADPAGDGSQGGAGAQNGTGAHGTGGSGATLGQSLPPNPEHAGLVQIFSGTMQDEGSAITATMAMAFFFDAPGAAAGHCSFALHGSCEVTTCEGGTPATMVQNVSAGAILVTAKSTLTLVPNAEGEYDPQIVAASFWDPGQTVTVSAAGGMVPAFEHSLETSSSVTIDSPVASPSGGALAIDRTEDFTLTWSGGTTGAVTTLWKVDPVGDDSTFVSIRCIFPASDGTGAIPTDALQALPEDATGDLLVLAGHIDAVQAGDYTVQVGVNSIAAWGLENGTMEFSASN